MGAGVFEGEGELKAAGDTFIYTGQFRAGGQNGQGKGVDTATGVSFAGAWMDGEPERVVASLDITPLDSEESYVTVSEKLKEEALDQLNEAPVDPKAKAKAKAKGKAKAAEPVPDDTPT